MHPWALNVPINSQKYLESTLAEGHHPTVQDYLALPDTRKFFSTVKKGPLNGSGSVVDANRVTLEQTMGEGDISLDTGTLHIDAVMT